MCDLQDSHEPCPICLEHLNCSSIAQCSTCDKTFHPQCIMKWIEINSSADINNKSCPHCRANDSITIDGEPIPEKEIIKYWDNGKKKFEKIIENKKFGRKIIIEKRWWSDGELKYEIILNSNNKLLSGNYFTYKYIYDMKTIPATEIEKVRTNSIHFIRIDGICL